MEDDKLIFREENDKEAYNFEGEAPWNILIVDDDHDVHETTLFSLQGSDFLGKPLNFFHAYSGQEAIRVLKDNSDIALVLLDAVMETEQAGLSAVQVIREELKLEDVRIILRTGQPGQVPELETITKYDINDYKTKNELTRTKLMTAIISALRSWQQIQRIKRGRQGLEKIVQASNQFIVEQGLQSFAEGVITQMAGLFRVDPEGIVCASDGGCKTELCKDEYLVIAAAGSYRKFINRKINKKEDEKLFSAIQKTLHNRESIIEKHSLTLFFSDSYGRSYATWVKSSSPLNELDTELLEIFCTNISLCASNIELVNRLKQQAWEDPVFKIPNMAALLEAIRKQLEEKNSPAKALLVLDIDGFYHINDMLGHDYGDIILKSVSIRLREIFGSSAFIARISSDVFGVLCDEVVVRYQVLRSLTSMLIQALDGEQELSVSVGITLLDALDGGASSQLKNGFVALKRAKAEGISQVVRYSDKMGMETRERIRLLHQLKEAFANSELFLVFQPQIRIEDQQPFSCEALLRWKNDRGEFVPPDRFIPLAEQAGLIVPIGSWVLRMALLALKRIHEAGFEKMRMAVNVSALQLRRKDFIKMLDLALEDTEVEPDLLEVEITESISALGIEDILKLLSAIRERGISIAIDDFGTGYSSLSSIDRWPVDRLKIDRSFIHNMEQKKEGARLIDLVIPLGNRLKVQVLAEGVETKDQLQKLRQLGCHEVQGYYFSRPLVLEDFISWLQTYRP